jgi:hypothetical protein
MSAAALGEQHRDNQNAKGVSHSLLLCAAANCAAEPATRRPLRAIGRRAEPPSTLAPAIHAHRMGSAAEVTGLAVQDQQVERYARAARRQRWWTQTKV